MGQMMRQRLISKEHAKVMANAGGVIGVWTHLVDSPAEYVQAVRDMVDFVGIDHVCIGTDTKLTQGSNPGGFGGPGGGPNRGRPNEVGGPDSGRRGQGQGGGGRGRGGGRTNEAWADQKVGFFYAVVGQMVNQGFTQEEISKVGGSNFCRVFGAIHRGRFAANPVHPPDEGR
jgi:microsomal dipeptidase-like Zn-dependent dipeptidase